ncbi:MAG: hypothetical protein Ct9H300mP21_01040 [Pseudomonadota bacterium]|nr:MAG: hypothetical protein Ct9H300mP21_01040 [Pseudomonadota bacterium]
MTNLDEGNSLSNQKYVKRDKVILISPFDEHPCWLRHTKD